MLIDLYNFDYKIFKGQQHVYDRSCKVPGLGGGTPHPFISLIKSSMFVICNMIGVGNIAILHNSKQHVPHYRVGLSLEDFDTQIAVFCFSEQ